MIKVWPIDWLSYTSKCFVAVREVSFGIHAVARVHTCHIVYSRSAVTRMKSIGDVHYFPNHLRTVLLASRTIELECRKTIPQCTSMNHI